MPRTKVTDHPFVSVIIPTYNRRAILEKCLSALLVQTYPHDKYEIIVIDDGSTDGTGEMVVRLVEEHGLREQSITTPGAEVGIRTGAKLPAEVDGKAQVETEAKPPAKADSRAGVKAEAKHPAETLAERRAGVESCVACRSQRLIYEWQEHTSAAAARNRGIRRAVGDLVILLDSDIVTLPDFIEAHVFARLDPACEALQDGAFRIGFSPDDKTIVHGRVIYTEDLDNPTSTQKRISDISMAFFASGNVSIARRWLLEAGLFDEDFTEYGWEDLELGQRLKKLGLRVVRSDKPAGYHLKHEFSVTKLPAIREREIQRGRMAVIYYKKHPTFSVRMSTTMIRPFYWLVGLLTLGGWPDRPGAVRLIDRLDKRGSRGLLGLLLQIMIYYWYIQGIKEGDVEFSDT
ncbi:MAG TPA: glycosyltransferase [Firmicutes bacterium]|jgi:glycosyltransferase involved in cell wall biosynthesis|nr:glycosyltransferase [Bacillota bacterium]